MTDFQPPAKRVIEGEIVEGECLMDLLAIMAENVDRLKADIVRHLALNIDRSIADVLDQEQLVDSYRKALPVKEIEETINSA